MSGSLPSAAQPDLPPRALRPTPPSACWVDARFGVAGDMLVAALVDGGAPLDALQAAVDAVIPGAVQLEVAEVTRAGQRALHCTVTSREPDPPHRRWSDLRDALAAADLAAPVSAAALAVFTRLAAAEARVHGTDPAEVHFHEVGAWDSIADVVATCAGLHALGVERLAAGPIALGSGTVRTAHGELPVPVPAVLELVTGWRVHAGGMGELATPTGVALLTTLAVACEELPAMTVTGVGVGAGSRDTPGHPNVVRVVLGTRAEPAAAGATGTQDAVLIEANVDDLDPRVWPSVLAGLLEAGAADAWLTPIVMKKGRPAHTLAVLGPAAASTELRHAIFTLVPTLGVRETTVAKHALERCWRPVEVAGHVVGIKLGVRDGHITSATPEFEEVAAAAAATGRPVREVLARAIAAAEAAGWSSGAPAPR
ncbi:MAG TPA: nickel pincer cofactor biosynthesis protein LarC [Candidatus Nanopelagicales bacterium]